MIMKKIFKVDILYWKKDWELKVWGNAWNKLIVPYCKAEWEFQSRDRLININYVTFQILMNEFESQVSYIDLFWKLS